MSQFYNLTSYKASGEPWSTEHGTFQTYWAEFEGIEGGVMMSKKVGNTPQMGAIYGDLILATSQKGNQYYKFKGAQRPEGIAPPQYQAPTQQTTAASTQHTQSNEMPSWFLPTHNMVKYIYDEMRKMDADAGKPMPVNTVEVAGSIDPETQEQLNDIFGEPRK